MTCSIFFPLLILFMVMPTPGEQASINTSPLKLAVQPKCGASSSSHFNNFNSGIDLTKIKTIYAFGDSYMSNGQSTGTTAPPPVQGNPNDPHFGGRASNGLVWVEQFSNAIGAVLKDYAMGGSTVSRALSPSTGSLQGTDMIQHVQTFLNQHNKIDASSSMTMISYGINDYASTARQGTQNLPKAAQELVRQTELLVQAGIRNVVIISPPTSAAPLNNFNDIVWNGLKGLQTKNPELKYAYVDFVTLYSAIISNPSSFGYQAVDSCLPTDKSMAGACPNPDVHLYYLPRHPQKLTHGLMAEWVEDVLSNCK
ncbi:uncharacterized protein MELLADRAFT_68520 [Melampsora larici-populina 98AG31]|uniref:Uncharacterized protein n=1 Tax=Melampsora larici-populina (strain 98AG31 / pathotype 3-4-7) TaxID=747676 RepID=F4S738_MELLP|nr:uncharacterized protein MELLADRAFT_68520 [Melampsora larici-populina 98AG31]EGF99570.1 hypothetical protein MELLADRAFT_68520 [Melampsora larici-populina 98AG31]